jgi:hypothetical protein
MRKSKDMKKDTRLGGLVNVKFNLCSMKKAGSFPRIIQHGASTRPGREQSKRYHPQP